MTLNLLTYDKEVPEMNFRPFFIPFILLLLITIANAQTNDDCLECHDDPELIIEKNGKTISLNIEPSLFTSSSHQTVQCIECHVGFDPDEEPHKPVIPPVDCTPCHEEAKNPVRHSQHSASTQCTSCHGDVHQPQSSKAINRRCEGCHEAEKEELAYSVHSSTPNAPLCFECHTPNSTSLVSSENCLSCHGKKEFVHTSITHKDVNFVLSYKESIHGENIECSDCHTGHRILAADSSQSTVNEHNIVATCSKCHDDVAEKYVKSEHGLAFLSGFESAPSCLDCHGEHDIHQITDSRSPVSREHEIEVCLSCHLDSPEVRTRMTHSAGFVAEYGTSIHGRAHKAGNLEAAVCSDCHGGHDELKASNPNSMVNKFNIATTCSKCHADVEEEFHNSIHGQALAEGVEDAPTCTNCHGEHDIIEPSRPESPVAAGNVSEEVCGPCHNSVELTEKYGISSDRFTAYSDSYHGLAVQFGSVKAANCASCHGVHNILPSSDPRSSINAANLATTCGECHPGANENFAKGKVHIVRSDRSEKVIYWISTIYIVLIVSTIGLMFVHNVLDWLKKVKQIFRDRYSLVYTPKKEYRRKLYIRMTLEERIQHWVLIISFFTLVLTGFMLKFPNAWWVVALRQMGGTGIFDLRGILHRIAAVVMVADSIYHIYYLFFTQRGRQFLNDIRFRIKDLTDMIQMLKYNLGLQKSKPQFGRFSYIEKSEYWALVWGTVIMSVTGVALWFENHFMGWFSKLFVDVCETIHYFEAWLAFLAIVVWHLYFVILNPDVYPMNFAWLTGKLTEEEMEKEHPLMLEDKKEKTKELEV